MLVFCTTRNALVVFCKRLPTTKRTRGNRRLSITFWKMHVTTEHCGHILHAGSFRTRTSHSSLLLECRAFFGLCQGSAYSIRSPEVNIVLCFFVAADAFGGWFFRLEGNAACCYAFCDLFDFGFAISITTVRRKDEVFSVNAVNKVVPLICFDRV